MGKGGTRYSNESMVNVNHADVVYKSKVKVTQFLNCTRCTPPLQSTNVLKKTSFLML
jgi:hypothetical protein